MKEPATRKSFRRIEEGSKEFNAVMAAFPEMAKAFYDPNHKFVQCERWVVWKDGKTYEPPAPK